MKILITAPSLKTNKNVSGISSVVNNILAITKLSYFHLVVGKEDQRKRSLLWVLDQITLPLKLIKTIISNKIDVFHLNAPLNPLAIARDSILLNIAKILRVKVVLHLHGGKYLTKVPEQKWLYHYLKCFFKWADHIIVLSDYEKQWIINDYCMKLEMVSSLPNCVPFTLRANNKIRKEKVRLIFLGRIVQIKGIKNIVESVSQLIEDRDDFEFYLYGDGPCKDDVVDRLSSKLGESFQYKGVVSGQSKIDAFLEADMFLLPSLSGEGLPVALLEAMSYGVIPIVTIDGSMGTVVQNGVNGYIVNKDDSTDLHNVLNKVISAIQEEIIDKVKEDAVNTIRERYDCKCYGEKLEKIYREVML